MAIVLLTDFAWPDIDLERGIIEGAGHALVAGSAVAGTVEEIAALSRNHNPDAILTCWAPVFADAIAAPENLQIVARLGVGLDNIDVAAASARGAWVTNVPDYCVEEVSDHAIAMLLDWTRGISRFNAEVKQGRWEPGTARLRRLSIMTIGIIGFGRIGRRTAVKLAPWGCQMLSYSRSDASAPGVMAVGLDDLLRNSDAVIIHAPLTAETHHLMSRERIAMMKPGGMLINVSRGAVVDSDAVIDALDAGHLAAAGLDVLEQEPVVPVALQHSTAAVMTPHIAFSSDASLAELRKRACHDVIRVLAGDRPHNPCNIPAAKMTENQ